ncbi:MAG: 3-hydroxyacyl-CoA dehydrogenase family protein [Candidatus Hermodarchaeota archaeon]
MNSVSNVSIIGAGFTGKQIAEWTVLHNFKVSVFDIKQDVLNDTKKFITGSLRRKKALELLNDIEYSLDLAAAVKHADLIIEAVPEDLELKRKVFSQVDKLAPIDAIIATNSSSFPISKIEDVVKRKDKVLNIHFYPPISVRPMADIMRGSKTSDETFQKGKEWIEKIECVPLILKKESIGFLFNRIWRAVKRECIEMWADDVAAIEDIDTAWRIFTGMPSGPFLMMDAIGLDVAYAVEQSYYEATKDPRDKPPEAFEEMVKRGDLGMKTGKGFYQWKKS